MTTNTAASNVDDDQPQQPASGHDTGLDALADDVLGDLLRALADAVLVADVEGRIVFWNTAAERLFGWSADEACGRTLDLVIPERLRNRHWDGWRNVVATGHTRYGDQLLEVPAVHRDGRQLSIVFTVSLLTSAADGEVTGVAAVVRDDTERWRQRREQRDEIARLRADPRLAEPAP